MKKIFYILIPIILLFSANGCSGYKPIYKSSNLKFKIVNYEIKGDQKLGKQVYSKFYNLSRTYKNDSQARSTDFLINVSKKNIPTAKNSAGKVLGYETTIITQIVVKDFETKNKILDPKKD